MLAGAILHIEAKFCHIKELSIYSIRRYATAVQNTQGFEHSVLTDVTCHHIAALQIPEALSFELGLVNPRRPSPAIKRALVALMNLDFDTCDIFISAESRFCEFETCQKGDVVLTRDGGRLCAAEVWCHACVEGILVSVVSPWANRCVDVVSRSAEWQKADNPTVIETTDIIASVVWMDVGAGVVRTLIPSDLM